MTHMSKIRQLIPPLSHEMHKGQAGRIGILGGSEEYTGAPYFSGISALKLGADLCHVFCEPSASMAIKAYSPDLIVHPYLRSETQKDIPGSSIKEIVDRVSSVLSRLDVLVVGPGLSRDALMQASAKDIVIKARKEQVAVVLDADGLFLIQHHPYIIQGYTKAVLTPNRVEFKRLCKTMGICHEKEEEDTLVQKLSEALGGVIIVQKGFFDRVSNGKQVLVCDREGGQKRMGGQGDILSGIVGTLLAWGNAYKENRWKHPKNIQSEDVYMLASLGACHLVKECGRRAYEKHGRSVLTSDMLNEIGSSYNALIKGRVYRQLDKLVFLLSLLLI
ncbi:H-hydrate dehydratase [Spinellus fusiger]|nr:H-hydrate dehydratase [Spinellus fusiger]